MKLVKLDKTGHTTYYQEEARVQFGALIAQGYAMFENDKQLRKLPDIMPDNLEVLALAPLVGG